MQRREICQQIDACRPTSHDLELPEMATLAEQLEVDRSLRETLAEAQRLDALIAKAMHAAPIPAGLADRILDALAADGAEIVPSDRSAASADRQGEQISPATIAAIAEHAHGLTTSRRQSTGSLSTRRRWLTALAACAALVIAIAAIWQFRAFRRPLTAESLLANSGQWHLRLSRSTNWNVLPLGQSLPDYPLAAAVRVAPRRWADATAVVGRPAVAYDLGDEQGRRATLFVIPAQSRIADAAPPRVPGSNTGGRLIGVWQVGSQVYVLVVEGDLQHYRNLLDVAGPPLA